MADDFQNYDPTKRFDNVQQLLGNHFRVVIDALPDLTFFAQTIVLPDISLPKVERANPFTHIPEVGDHIVFSPLTVNFIIDNQFKTYFSLWYWFRGVGFPHSYDDIGNFQASRKAALANPRPIRREIEKTNLTLLINHPDSDSPVATIFFEDVWPTQIGQVTFSSTDSEPPMLTTQVTFAYTDFTPTLTLNP